MKFKFLPAQTIFTGFAPNLTKSDFKKACGFIFLPWRWSKLKKGSAPQMVEDWLKKYLKIKYVITFDSGRSALYFALKALNLPEDSEVLIQAYTCVVVTNAIIWNKLTPVYADIGNDFNIDANDLLKKITPKTKVVIIQHTFGKPADLEKIIAIAREHNLIIIEDSAHTLGIKYQEKFLGTVGDIGILSFGSDKPVSCVRGGAVITNREEYANKLEDYQNNLKNTGLIKIFQHLLHYLFFYLGKITYHLKIGKILLSFAKKINLINRIIYSAEKKGQTVKFYPKKLPNVLALLLLKQLARIDEFNEQRAKISDKYQKEITNQKITKPENFPYYLRFPILVNNPEKLKAAAKKEGIILGDWYNSVVAPKDIVLKTTRYIPRSCPKAEELTQKTLNLPTDINITPESTMKIIDFINNYEL